MAAKEGAPGQPLCAAGGRRRTVRSRRPSVHDGRNDAVVTLEDQVVKIGRGYRAQDWQLRGRLGVVEHIERPITGGASLQVRVVSSSAVIGADNYWADPRSPLPGPRQSPNSFAATAVAPYTSCGNLAGVKQQVCVDLPQ